MPNAEGRMPKTSRLLLIAFMLASVTTLSSCGYSLAGRGSFLPESIRVIGIPLFGNQSPVYGIEQTLTERVRNEFINRGKYRVTPEPAGADASLTCDIVSINVNPSAFNDSQQATRYIIIVTTKIEFKDLKADKVLWSNPGWQFREEYQLTTATNALQPEALFGRETGALDRLATDFSRSVVSAILEAF
jgi:outer membrane lipopolysaccharide assembly protein LptE/RlpB